MHRGLLSTTKVQHQDDERRVLLRLAGGRRANVIELKSDLARLSGERVPRALQALQRDGLATHEDRPGRPNWWLTEAGESKARELAEAARAPRTALPVLPDPITPAAAFDCTRRGAILKVSQCAGAWEARTTGPCASAADGTETREGCAVGKRASEAMRERHVARVAAQRARKERQVA